MCPKTKVKHFFIVLALLGATKTALADKYAIVIGGASKKQESSQQEFARNTIASTIGLEEQGYNVVTLFSSLKNEQESNKYAADFEKFNSLPGAKKSATDTDIDKTFEDLISKIKPQDKVEILVSAHGNDTCGELGQLNKNDLSAGCEHTFTVYDKDGHEVQYPSKKLLSYLKKLEEKGALPSLVLGTCHSGRAKENYKNLGLKNSCVYFQSAGNELGYGCFEDDPDFSRDFTSSGEYLAMRYYQQSLKRLASDPYFAKSQCFQKTKKTFENNKYDLTSISSAYWSSRRFDETYQSPAISSTLDISYFTKGLLQPRITKQQSLSCSEINMTNSDLIKQLNALNIEVTDAASAPYFKALNEYNQSASELRDAIDSGDKNESTLIPKLQENVRTKAAAFMKQERLLIDGLFKRQSPATEKAADPCERPL